MLERPDGRALSIFIGTHEIVRQVHDIGVGLRALGHQVTTVLRRRNPLYPDLPYDHVVHADAPATATSLSLPPIARRAQRLARRTVTATLRMPIPAWVWNHEFFIFFWGSSLLPLNSDLQILRRLGKTVICVFLGTDIRHWSATEQYRAAVGLGTYDGYRAGRSLDKAVRTLRLAELHADAWFLQPSFGELAIAPYLHLYLAVDLSNYRFHVPRREVPVVVHAPSRRAVKGTAEILAAAEALRRQGVEFELRLLEGMPNAEVRAHLADADVVVDQLNESHYGMLGLEAMASGCVVLGGNRPDIVPVPRNRPVLHVTPTTIQAELESIIRDGGRRTALADQGRAFVERYHDHVAVAADVLRAPERVRQQDHDYHPRWFVDHFELQSGLSLSRWNRARTAAVARRSGLSEDAILRLRSRHLA